MSADESGMYMLHSNWLL